MDALSLLAQAHEAGLAVAIAGDKLIVRGPRRAEPTVRLLAKYKPAVMTALAADWCGRHREALVYWSAFHPADEAAQLAWGELLNEWHRRHGRRAPEWQCAGCGEPLGRAEGLLLGDKSRVHLGDTLACLLSFGEHWRNEATAGLRAFGLRPPAGFEP
jgi:hypothetical protein